MSTWKKYLIEKGYHVSEPIRLGFHLGRFPHRWSRDVIFGQGCSYSLGGLDQLDINKLWGHSQWNHLRNSFRFGWRWNEKRMKVELLPFVTSRSRDNRLTAEPLAEAELNSAIQTAIILERDRCHFECGGNDVTIEFDGFHGPRFGYSLRPYFGGNRVAPHDIEIYIK